jgi:hypothetical protein
MVPLVAVVVGGAVAVLTLQAERQRDAEPYVLSPAAVDARIQPAWASSPPGKPTPSADPSPAPTEARPSAEGPESFAESWIRSDLWWVLALVLLAMVVAVLLRMVWVALAWRRLRRRLRREPPVEQVKGAWVWALSRLRAAGSAVPRSASVDAVASGDGMRDVPRTLREPLRAVAESAVTAAFAPTAAPTAAEVEAVWRAADEVGRGAVARLGARRRVLLAVRPISSVPSATGSPSDHVLESRS